MSILLLIGISMDLVRAENQYRSQPRYQNNNRQQQRLQPNVSDAEYPSYYYECV